MEESAVATEQVCLLMLGYLSQQIWESGQLKNVSINLPSLHFPTTTLLLHKLTGTKESKQRFRQTFLGFLCTKGYGPGVFK